MKYLRVFETDQERQSVVSRVNYSILSSVNGVITLDEASGPGPTPSLNHYIGIIRLNESSNCTIIAADSASPIFHPLRVIVDGVEMQEIQTQVQLEAGEHTIEIYDDPENEGYYTMWQTPMTSSGGYFEQCEYSEMVIPDYVTEVGEGALHSCEHMTSITLGNNVTSIGDRSFMYCEELVNVTLPSSLLTIGEYAFGGCRSLRNIVIPENVTEIGYDAFYDDMLESFTCLATVPPTVDGDLFENVPIYVPADSVNAYKTAWPNYASQIQAIQ